MSKKKLTDEQQELLTLLPDKLPTLSQAAQLILANIILKYGTDYAKEYGQIYRTNEDMAQDTGLSKQTVITSVRKLEALGLITRCRGSRGRASDYDLSDDIKQQINFVKADTKTCQDTNNTEEVYDKGQITELYGKITSLAEMIDNISQIINGLDGRIATIENVLENKTEKPYYTTESDIELDIDKKTLNNINQDIDSSNESISPAQKNQYVKEAYEWFDAQLDKLYKVKDKRVYDDLNNKILQYNESLDRSQFSDKQWEVLFRKDKRWKGIQAAKERFFNRHGGNVSGISNTDTSKKTATVNGYHKTSIRLIDFLSNAVNKKCRDFSKAEAKEWVSNEVEKYPSFESWEEHTTNQFNSTFCEGWDMGIDGNAMDLFYTACDYAEKHYQEMDKIEPQADDGELAPWETPVGSVFRL